MIEFHYDDGAIVLTWNRSLTINIFIHGENVDCVTIQSWWSLDHVTKYCDAMAEEILKSLDVYMHEITAQPC